MDKILILLHYPPVFGTSCVSALLSIKKYGIMCYKEDYKITNRKRTLFLAKEGLIVYTVEVVK